MCHHARLIFEFLVEMASCHVTQAGLELLSSGNQPASAFQSARIIGVSHCARLLAYFFLGKYPVFQYHLLKRLSFPQCIFLATLLKMSSLQTCRFASVFSILFCWAMCLFLCQYHAVLVPIALQYNLKSVNVVPPVLFFFAQDSFGYSGSFVIPYKFYNWFSIFVKNVIGILIGITSNLQISLGNMDFFFF